MKDKRQRMSLVLPYGVPLDPHLYAYVAAAAAAAGSLAPFPLSPAAGGGGGGGGGVFAGGVSPAVTADPSSALRLAALQARADLLTSPSDLITSRPELMMTSPLSFAGRKPLLLDARPYLTPSRLTSHPFGFGVGPGVGSEGSAFRDLSGLLGAGRSLSGPLDGMKLCSCSNPPTLHRVADHLAHAAPPVVSPVGVPRKAEVHL